MLKLLSLLGILFVSLASNGLAQSELVVARQGRCNSPIGFHQQADYVCLPVFISTWSRNTNISQFTKQNLTQAVIGEVEKQTDILFLKNPPPLSFEAQPEVPSKLLRQQYNSRPDFYLMIRLRGTARDIAACTMMMRQFLRNISVPEKTKFRYEEPLMIAENPEQYRQKILELISKEAFKTQQSLANGKVTVAGLEKPVLVREVDEGTVEFFIDYKMSFGL